MAAPAGSIQASLSFSLSVVLGSLCGLSMGTSLGFLRAWQPLSSQAVYMVTEDIKGKIIPDSMAEVGSLFMTSHQKSRMSLPPYCFGCNWMISPLRFKSRGIRLYFWRSGKEDTVVAIFGKYNLPHNPSEPLPNFFSETGTKPAILLPQLSSAFYSNNTVFTIRLQ